LSGQAPESGRRYAWAIAVLLAAFMAGLAALMMLRFESGDVYPPYSSLRSDPLGTRALFESLNTLAPDTARRGYRPPDRVSLDARTTLLICGLSPEMTELRGPVGKRLMDRLAADGGRVVITFGDRARAPEESEPDSDEAEKPAGDEATPVDPQPDDDKADEEKIWNASENLGVTVALARRGGAAPVANLADTAPPAGLPAAIPWRGAQYLPTVNEDWDPIYFIDRTDRPVMVRRAWGRGELVLAADSFPLSNEALRKERSTPVLTWLLPPDQRIVFDEFHHGIARQPGIATLSRKYGLEKILGALAILGLLFVWRQNATFVPPAAAERQEWARVITGGDSGQGLVSLMQRHIPARQLISVCFSTWQAGPAARHVRAERQAMARQWLEENTADRHDPVAAYGHIAHLLEQRKTL
jgi:hypothetical protein